MENTVSENEVENPVVVVSSTVEESLLVDLNTRAEELVTSSETIENLLIEQGKIQEHIYVSLLFIIGITVSAFVLFLLYKFIKLFY